MFMLIFPMKIPQYLMCALSPLDHPSVRIDFLGPAELALEFISLWSSSRIMALSKISVLCLILLTVSFSNAWSFKGHQIVAGIATSYLNSNVIFEIFSQPPYPVGTEYR